MTTLELTGLKGHHPLGFLAACGLFRVANDDFEVKLGWSPTSHNDVALVACLYTSCFETQGELRQRIAEVVPRAAKRYLDCLRENGLTEAEAQVDDYRRIGREIIGKLIENQGLAQPAAALLSSIGSDLVTLRKNTGKKKGQIVISNSHFLMTSGQQDILKEGKARKPAAKLAKLQKARNAISGVHEKIGEVLFGPWLYEDDDHSLGWDPQIQRLHALRNKEPTNDNKKRSVSAAVFLASQALPLFPCFAVDGRLRTTGFLRDNGADWFAWPHWRDPISLDTLRSLLAHPFNSGLKRRGVEVVYRSRRVRTGGSEGNYQMFSHAEVWPWPSETGRSLA